MHLQRLLSLPHRWIRLMALKLWRRKIVAEFMEDTWTFVLTDPKAVDGPIQYIRAGLL